MDNLKPSATAAASGSAAADSEGFKFVSRKKGRKVKDVGGPMRPPTLRATSASIFKAPSPAVVIQMTPKWAEVTLARSQSHARATFSFRTDPRNTGSDYASIDKDAVCRAAIDGLYTLFEQGYPRYPTGTQKLIRLDGLKQEMHAECQIQIQRDINSRDPYGAFYTITMEYPGRLQPMLRSFLLTRDGCIMLNLPGRKASTPAQFHYNSNPIDDTLPGTPVSLLQFKADRHISAEALVECLNENGASQGFTVLYAGTAEPAPTGSTGFIIKQVAYAKQTILLCKAGCRMTIPKEVAVPWATDTLPSGIVALVRGGKHLLPKQGHKGGFTLQAVSDKHPAAQVDIRVQMSRVPNRTGIRELSLPSPILRDPLKPWGTTSGSAGAAVVSPAPAVKPVVASASPVASAVVQQPTAPTASASAKAPSKASPAATTASNTVAVPTQAPLQPATTASLTAAIAAPPASTVTGIVTTEASPVADATITPSGTASVPTATTAITDPPLPHAPTTLPEAQLASSAGLDMALDLQTDAADATVEHHDFARNVRNKGRPGLELDEPDAAGRPRKTTAVPLHGVQGHAPGLPPGEDTLMEHWPALVPGASAGKLR